MSAFTIKSKLINIRTVSSMLVFTTLLSLSCPLFADVTYGPVKSKDTLGKIVNRFYVGNNRSSISLMKTIVANNPNAFVRGDMNLLKRDALLRLPGSDWLVNEPRFVSPSKENTSAINASTQVPVALDSRSLPSRTPQQMQERIIFLEAERVSLISQVEELKRNTVRLEEKVKQLEVDSRNSDDQLRVLDQEIIRLTELLSNKGNNLVQADLIGLNELQEKLHAVQQETEFLRGELSEARVELSNNSFLKSEADKTIAQLVQENQQLQHLLQESQPGVHYFGDNSRSDQLSLLGGKLHIPLWTLILGGSLFSLVMVSLLATRRKNAETSPNPSAPVMGMTDVPTESFGSLLETPDEDIERGFAQPSHRPEENVFKMFDEGSLEMDLKLDMAEAYLDVADFESARSMLQEVIDGGSELQQRKASRLMRQAA